MPGHFATGTAGIKRHTFFEMSSFQLKGGRSSTFQPNPLASRNSSVNADLITNTRLSFRVEVSVGSRPGQAYPRNMLLNKCGIRVTLYDAVGPRCGLLAFLVSIVKQSVIIPSCHQRADFHSNALEFRPKHAGTSICHQIIKRMHWWRLGRELGTHP